jgi:hypothetical protein
VDRQATATILAQEVVVQLHGPVEAAVEAAVAEELHHGNQITTRTTEAIRVTEVTVRVATEVTAMANKATATRDPDTDLTATVARSTDTKTNATRTMAATAAINLRRLRHQLMFRLRLPQAISRRLPRQLERTDCTFPGLLTRLGCL